MSRRKVIFQFLFFSFRSKKVFGCIGIVGSDDKIEGVATVDVGVCKLSIKFNDAKKMITVNIANKIIIHSIKDYTKIKKKAIYYNYMNENDNRIEFKEI